MGSLFEDRYSDNHKSQEGVCDVLRKLSWQKKETSCSYDSSPKVLLVNKGALAPLSLGGATEPTVFTLEKFHSEMSRAVFTYLDSTSSGEVTRQYVADCQTLAGIVCLNDD